MRRMICLLLAGVLCMMLVACGDSSDHIGEAKTPSGSSVMEGRDYESVVESFEEKGFTNIRLEKIEDLVTGWLTDDGEVEKVTVGGDENYSPDKWIDANTEVVIYYHTFPSDDNSSNNTQENVPLALPTILLIKSKTLFPEKLKCLIIVFLTKVTNGL